MGEQWGETRGNAPSYVAVRSGSLALSGAAGCELAASPVSSRACRKLAATIFAIDVNLLPGTSLSAGADVARAETTARTQEANQLMGSAE